MVAESATPELPEPLRASVQRFIEVDAPVAGVTCQRGTTFSVNVARTSLRSDSIVSIARRYPVGAGNVFGRAVGVVDVGTGLCGGEWARRS